MHFLSETQKCMRQRCSIRSTINWETVSRYLGVYLESSVKFKCSFSTNKARFYKAFNNIFGKIGRNASEEVIFALIKSKCFCNNFVVWYRSMPNELSWFTVITVYDE